ncbi:hypothetical protein PHLCEN_2v188 [Hermanssonia centrifuga]|uniref:Uncharacterized protein n=1 Tax=Hermanssonia centrifuga TaxID=98765 RepID=A0A2R6S6P7_9APHY|nr:hypothetical protein PHLCEN_2v188 [Hermanssonia centrifuga]
MQEQGYKTLLPGPELEFMSAAVQGRARDANYLVMAVKYAPHSVPRDNVSILKQMACPHRNLSRTQLEALLSDLYSFFYNLQSHPLRHQEAGARDFITQTRSRLSRDREDRMEGQIDTAGSVASDVGEWLRSYLE